MIRERQMDPLFDDWNDRWINTLVHSVRAAYPDRVPSTDAELRQSVEGWLNDARASGLKEKRSSERYVMSRAWIEGERPPLASRLRDYLATYQPHLIEGVAVDGFAKSAVAFAAENNVIEEEGVTWLAVILLSGRQKGDWDMGWVKQVLTRRGPEENRVRAVHDEAVVRGWVRASGE